MRPALLVLLALALLPRPAHADTLDNFSVVGNGQDFEFSLPASVTGPGYAFDYSYSFGALSGTLNGVPSALGVNIVFPGPYIGADTFTVSNSTSYTELVLPSLYSVTVDPFAETAVLAFIPGDYSTFTLSQDVTVPSYPYTLTITPQTTAATPEPPTLLLLATAILATSILLRRMRSADPSRVAPDIQAS